MQFYVLSLRIAESPYAEIKTANKPVLSDPPRCMFCGTTLAPLVPLPPYRYRFIRRDGPGDLLTNRLDFAVSQRFAKAFDQSALSGLRFSDAPLELLGSDLEYYMAFPECTLTLLDEEGSGVVVEDVRGCEKCRVIAIKKIERIVIREETWEGQDVFMCGHLSSAILVTQRFVDFVAEHQFTNFHFVHQSEFHFDYSFGK
jgi:hypothetical protein